MVNHGKITHPFDDRYDCLVCLDVEIDYLTNVRDAGGQTKFIKELTGDLKTLKKYVVPKLP